MGSPGSTPSRRRTTAIVAAAAAVAAVLGGAGVAGIAVDDDPATPTAAAPSQSAEPVLELDLGQVASPDPEVIAGCLVGGFAGSADAGEVLYGVRQRSADGEGLVLLLRNADGELLMCDSAGHDVPAQLPRPEATATEPVAFLTNGTMTWSCSGTTVDGFRSTVWLRVAPEVDRVQQRFWVDGVAGPWFSTNTYDGYAHLQAWLTGPLAKSTKLAVEQRALDSDGRALDQDAFADRPVRLAGCRGGDVAIG
jgi:hypothetical protein